MSVELNVQYSEQLAEQAEEPPSKKEFLVWAELSLRDVNVADKNVQIGIRIVNEAESQSLNKKYRDKNNPTNVLSFPMDMPENPNAIGPSDMILGDLVICAPLIGLEARQQKKSLQAHWAHMVIHGMLHLQGYDHISDDQAREMENLEITLLQQLEINNPYEDIQELRNKK